MSFWSATRLVAGRELRERARSRSFKVSSVITLLLVAGFVLLPNVLPDSGDPEWDLAVVGPTPEGFDAALDAVARSLDATITVVRSPDDADPVRLLEGDDAPDAVLVDGRELLADGDPAPDLRSAVATALSQARLQSLIAGAGVDPADVEDALGDPLSSGSVDETAGDATGIAFIGIVVLFIAINSYGAWVLTGVLEEKSSRVVELVVAAVPARALLAGKVLGIGALGLGQLTVIGLGGLALALATGATDLPDGLAAGAAWALVWFVLGFAFFAVAYATAGSLVSRQEDAQTAATPIVMVVLASYFVSLIFVAPDTGSSTARIVSLLPPVAPMAMPARIAEGAAEAWEIGLAVGLMLVATWALVAVAARVYEHALLRTGAPLGLRDVVGAARAGR
ncbi:MAG TPA: ABC transporter permease [Acidimicrobiales bacterium]|nr:ABC transporter permease [Acidimicrobiales bacterium]